MSRIKKAQGGDTLKRSRTYRIQGGTSRDIRGTKMKADYSVDTTGYAAGKKKFPTTIKRSEVSRPAKVTTLQGKLGRKKVSKLISQKRAGGSIKPKASNVSKKLGSVKKKK